MRSERDRVLKARIIGQPTPQHVLNAISDIQEYLRNGGWCQAIINSAGGVSFRLTDVHKDYLSLLQRSSL